MKLHPAFTALFLLCALSACSARYSSSEGHPSGSTDMAAQQDIMLVSPDDIQKSKTIAPRSLPQLAYDYQYRFSAPKSGIKALIAADQSACDKAGPEQCQLISLSTNSDEDLSSHTLDVRVSPTWLKAYEANMAHNLKAHHARLTTKAITSEDLSLQIVDTEAHIKNKEALRDRLQSIIKSGNAKVGELIEAETQLANTQADIDSAKSQLLVMQKRVATIHLTLTYESEEMATSYGTFTPITDALKSSLRNMMGMVGFLITLLSFCLPLIIIGIPAFIYGRKWWLKRKAAKTPKPKKE